MAGWGIFLIVIGGGSFILPMMGRQFILVSWLGEARPYVAVAMIIVGIALVVLSAKKGAPASSQGQGQPPG